MNSPIEALVEQAKGGSRPAFDRLTLALREPLEKLICARLGPELRSRVEVDDVLQETLLRAFRSIASIEWQGEKAFLAWLETIAVRAILDEAGKRKGPELAQHPSKLAGSHVSPSRALRREERLERLKESLKALPPEYREVILLARIERMSLGQIAERLGRSPEAVRKLLARGLRKLKERFGDTESLHLPEKGLEDNHDP